MAATIAHALSNVSASQKGAFDTKLREFVDAAPEVQARDLHTPRHLAANLEHLAVAFAGLQRVEAARLKAAKQFVTVDVVDAVEVPKDDISALLKESKAPVYLNIGNLPNWVMREAPPGHKDVLIAIIPATEANPPEGEPAAEKLIVVKHWLNTRKGEWSPGQMTRCGVLGTTYYVPKLCGQGPASKKPVQTFRHFLGRAGGYQWCTYMVAQPTQEVIDEREAFEKRSKESQWIIENAPMNCQVELENWVETQPQENNPASQSPVRDWDTSAIWRIIKAHKTNVKGAKVIRENPHTLLSLDEAAISDFVRFISTAQTKGLVCLGLNGTGKTSCLTSALLAFSRLYVGGLDGTIFSIAELDSLRGKRATGATPVFLDDSCLKKCLEAFLKHYFGVPNIPQEVMLQVRFEHATITHDCPRAASENPVDQAAAALIQPGAMTVETLLKICRPCWSEKIDEEDLAAVYRRISLMVFCKAPDGGVVVYVSLVNRAFPAGRDLTWFRLGAHGHIFKESVKDREDDYARLGSLPEGFEEEAKVEQHNMAAIMKGSALPAAMQGSHPAWWQAVEDLKAGQGMPHLNLMPANAAQGNAAAVEAVADEQVNNAREILRDVLQQATTETLKLESVKGNLKRKRGELKELVKVIKDLKARRLELVEGPQDPEEYIPDDMMNALEFGLDNE
jgi:hypothetical protein